MRSLGDILAVTIVCVGSITIYVWSMVVGSVGIGRVIGRIGIRWSYTKHIVGLYVWIYLLYKYLI